MINIYLKVLEPMLKQIRNDIKDIAQEYKL
jgi:hypothetical protein